MPSYKNEKCPVCDTEFKDGDDIVTCPVCGTPHHRECYNKIGHCINEDKHKDGFEYKKTATKQEEPKNNESENNTPFGAYFVPSSDENEQKGTASESESKNTKKCVNCGEEINKNAPFCNKCGAQQPFTASNQSVQNEPFIPSVNTGYENSDLKIDGESAEEVAGVVKTNIPKFMEKFQKGKKVSWNWGGFIFGPYYLFFRKMYKEGSIFLALQLIVSLVAQGIYAKPYAKLMQFVMDNAASFSSGNLSNSLLNKFVPLYQDIFPMVMIILGANLIFHIIIALFCDSFYKSKVVNTVRQINKKLEEDSMFEQMMPFQNSAPLSQEDLKKLYLGKMGGTSLFAPVLAFCALDIITSIISRL